MTDADSVAQLFEECDVHGRGWLGLEDLYRVCPTLSDDERRYIFDRLDSNKDGRIVRDEFIQGFASAVNSGEKSGYKGLAKRASVKNPKSRRSLKSSKEESNRPDTNKSEVEISYQFEPESASLDQLPW